MTNIDTLKCMNPNLKYFPRAASITWYGKWDLIRYILCLNNLRDKSVVRNISYIQLALKENCVCFRVILST